MHRRHLITQAATLCGAALMPWAVQAQAKIPRLGTDYETLDRPAPVDAPAGKIEVVEFFWYSCPHCYAFEPSLQDWLKRLPADVAFRRVPVAFNDSYAWQQRLFYALQNLGLVETLHSRVFTAIHVEHQRLTQPDAIADWVAKQGVDRAKFFEVLNSFGVNAQATRANQLTNAYRVEGVPALGIAGRFYTDGSMAQTMDRVLMIADYLTAEVRAKRA
jgi:thiol:disulfide interchange protein DsbA